MAWGERTAKSQLTLHCMLFTIYEPPFSGSMAHTEVCQSEMRGVSGWSWQEEDLLI